MELLINKILKSYFNFKIEGESMIDIKKKEECCGCYACTNVCPKICIEMKVDDEGFWYPQVKKEKCIECGLCEKVCPVINSPKIDKNDTMAYACINNNEESRKMSSSGGIFSLLCDEVIRNKGVVFGAGFDENFEVIHSYSETLEGCSIFRGSKYVQSKIGNTYKEAKEFLDNGRIVLFSGTQCQIKGLILYLRKKYDNLIAMEVVCHGVPSPKVFRNYRDLLSKKYNSQIKYIRFRDKTKGWKKFSYVTKFINNEKYSKTLKKDLFTRGFLKNLYLRPSCYDCKAKNYTSGSDLSLADYWGIQKKHPKFDDDKGTSLVLVNSSKGKEIFDSISKNMRFLETDLQYATANNPCIVRPVKYNADREKFFKEIEYKSLENIINKYTKISIRKRIKNKVKRFVYKF